jgi:hypothetical protein
VPADHHAVANLGNLLQRELLDTRSRLALVDLELEVPARLVRAVTARCVPPPQVPVRSAPPVHVGIEQGDRGLHITAVHCLKGFAEAGQDVIHLRIVAAFVWWIKPPALQEPGCEDTCMDEKPRSRSEDAALVAARRALAGGEGLRAVVLVEGLSDQCAVEALAERRGRDLRAERTSVVPIGGAQAIGQFLNMFGPAGLDVRLAGICDAGEEGDFRRGLERAGLGSRLTRADMERLGFFVCSADLEDELIRALGADSVEQVVEAEGELGSFRTLQKQPEWRGRSVEQQLRRFMGSGSGRKIRYARLLVDALDLTQVPRPLDLVLASV